MPTGLSPQQLIERHGALLRDALRALDERGAWTPFVESPSRRVYGESARQEGQDAFEARLGGPFPLDLPGERGRVGEEVSPYGFPLEVRYPSCDPDALIAAAGNALEDWSRAHVDERAGVLIEALVRLNRRSFELGFATMHTTGQGFVMAFQAGGPHAQDRGLEALAAAYRAMTAVPTSARWEKPVGRDVTVRLDKRYRLLPRGIGLVIGCSTFPTWNAYPGLFASLATGNAVIVKPHPGAVLPLAITVEVLREVLAESGFDPDLVLLAVDSFDAPLAARLAVRPEIGVVDFTGGSQFGAWLEQNARHAALFTEKSGINPMVLDGVADLDAVADNIAFTVSLYSGQMCTATQNIFVPRDGIDLSSGRARYEDVVDALVAAIGRLLSDDARAVEVLGCLQNERTLERLNSAETEGARALLASRAIDHASFPRARVRTPAVLETEATQRGLYMRDMFGPVSYVVRTAGTTESLALAAECARRHGAITASVYTLDETTMRAAERQLTDAGVPVSFNLTGPIWVNQAAAFSDYHVSGANPAGSGTFCDAGFVIPRFRVVQSRQMRAPGSSETVRES